MKRNLFDDIPGELPEELILVLAESGEVKIERIVSGGHVSPDGFWYDQAQAEWILIVAGSATLSLELDSGIKQVELSVGDHLLIPAHQRHRVESTDPDEKTVWLAVFF